MNELQHILHSLNSEKASRLRKAAVALMLALLLALTPGLAFATAGDPVVQDTTDVAAEVVETPEDDTADFEAESNSDDADASATISTATAEDPNAPEVGNEDPDPDAGAKALLDGELCGIGENGPNSYVQFSTKSEYERALAAHDALIALKDCYFDPTSTTTGVNGILSEKVSSQSYYAAFSYYMTKLAIEVVPQEHNGHMWALAKLDGEWTHIDIAYDDALESQSLGHLCFGLDDTQIALIHEGYKNTTDNQASGVRNNYYRVNYESTHILEGVSVEIVENIQNAISVRLSSSATATLPAPYLGTDPIVGGVPFKRLIFSQIAACLNGDYIDDVKKNKASVTYSSTVFSGSSDGLGYDPDPSGGSYSVTILKDINNAVVTNVAGTVTPIQYTGKPIEQNPQVALGGVLKKGTDYTIAYESNTYPGTATMIIKGLGVYANTEKRVPFKIAKATISNDTIKIPNLSSMVQYTGQPIRQDHVTVTHSTNGVLTSNDYSISYKNNTEGEYATMYVTGKGNYTGTYETKFRIVKDKTQSSGSGSSSGSGNNGATNVTTQAVPTAKTVSGTWKKSGGKWWFSYDAKTTKAERKSWPANEWVLISGKRYHFDGRGYMNTGWFSYGGKWYFLGSDGAMKTSWQKSGGKWYYMASDGVMQTGKKNLPDGKTYYLNPSSGAMKTGWNKEGSTWYYYNSSGAMVTKNWVKSSGKWYYFGSNGAMQTSKQTIGSQVYNFASSGAMITGWNKENGTYYHYGSSGAMTKKWLKSGGKWYYLDPSTGAMWTKQLEKIDGKTYAFHPSTGEMLVGWFKLTHPTTKVSNMYYFDSSGVMAANKWVGNYYLESDGRMARDKWIDGKYHVNTYGYWDATKK